VKRREGEFRTDLRRAGLDQWFVGAAPADIVVTAVDARTVDRYGQRGKARYVPMEAGHVGENIYLQAEALDLATVAVGAFRDEEVRSLLELPDDHRPLYIFPVGNRRDTE
jgi:SagB-type dehydrogenase family enzyme